MVSMHRMLYDPQWEVNLNGIGLGSTMASYPSSYPRAFSG